VAPCRTTPGDRAAVAEAAHRVPIAGCPVVARQEIEAPSCWIFYHSKSHYRRPTVTANRSSETSYRRIPDKFRFRIKPRSSHGSHWLAEW
jgi:hypothetical protein